MSVLCNCGRIQELMPLFEKARARLTAPLLGCPPLILQSVLIIIKTFASGAIYLRDRLANILVGLLEGGLHKRTQQHSFRKNTI